MSERWRTATRRALGTIAGLLLLAFAFQNCGKAGFDANLDSTIDVGISDAELTAKYGSTQAAKVSSIPFSFESSFDQIAYNSCAESQLKGNAAFFSIKAGAYRTGTGGVSLRQSFFDYVDSNFFPIYPETTISENQYKEYLADSPSNHNSVPVMAIRVRSSLNDVYSTSNSLTLGVDVVPMVGYLTDSGVMDAFVGTRTKASYFPFSPQYKVMEATMALNSSEGVARSYRDILMNQGALTLAYLDDASQVHLARSPSSATPLTTAYGKGYQFTFSQPIGATKPNIPTNNVYSIREYDLENSSNVVNWNCNRRYKVIRSQDAATYCPSHTYAELQNESVRAEMEIVRRQFPSSEWDFNVLRGCAVPKGSVSCYKEETYNGSAVGAQYDLTQDCFQPYGTYTGSAPLPRCAHFISICLR